MSSAVLLAFTPDANMRAVGEAADAAGLALMLCGHGEVPSRGSLPSDRPLILLAVGPEGGADLARWVGERGLDGVVGVGLVGVTAPWAERVFCAREAKDGPAILKAAGRRLPLGPLEPLRGVAERALFSFGKEEPHHPDPGIDAEVKADQQAGRATDAAAGIREGWHRAWSPMRLVIGCAPGDGVCATCAGRAIVSVSAPWGRSDATCPACVTGKALSSFDVACELLGRRITDRQSSDGDGGLEAFVWHAADTARLVELALRFVVARLAR